MKNKETKNNVPKEHKQALIELTDDFLMEIDCKFDGYYRTVDLTEKIIKLLKKI